MNTQTLLLTLIASIAFAAGFTLGCSSETNVDFQEEGVFSCSSDNECLRGFECDLDAPDADSDADALANSGYCVRISFDDDGDGDVVEPPDSCEPEDLGDDYPLETPLDIPEVCDGVDNNCDGNVDILFCQRTSDCPSNPNDPDGTTLQRSCNSDTGRCEYFAPNQFACPDPIPCTDGAFELVPPDCR